MEIEKYSSIISRLSSNRFVIDYSLVVSTIEALTSITVSRSKLFSRIPGSSSAAKAIRSRSCGGGSSRSRLKAPNCLKPS